jgi:hypothetical protein
LTFSFIFFTFVVEIIVAIAMKKNYSPFLLIGLLLLVSVLSLVYLHSFSVSASLPVTIDEGVKTMIEEEHQLPDVALLKKIFHLVWKAFIPSL